MISTKFREYIYGVFAIYTIPYGNTTDDDIIGCTAYVYTLTGHIEFFSSENSKIILKIITRFKKEIQYFFQIRHAYKCVVNETTNVYANTSFINKKGF